MEDKPVSIETNRERVKALFRRRVEHKVTNYPRCLKRLYPEGMDGFSHLSPDERAAMDALRARLRAKAEAVVAVVETVVDDMQASREDPLTLEDGCKTVRLMRQADAMVCQLYATPESVIRTVATSKPAPVAATVTPAAPVTQPKPPPDPNSWAAELARINAGYYNDPDDGDDDDDDVSQSVSPESPSDDAVAEAPVPVVAATPIASTVMAPRGGEPTCHDRPLTGPYRRQTKPPD